MAIMQWSDKWGFGLAEPDADRRELVGLYNEIDLALKRGDSQRTLIAGLTRLLVRAESFFAEEEKFMEAAGYPLWPEHRDEHHDFLQRMRNFESALIEGRLAIDLPVLQFLRHWLTGHLDESDGAFGRFLARNPEALVAVTI
ncbi:hemerythrin family protein [bacterium]|nr:hemerythrin family protein [bacterium]MBU1074420.1 hemerythrin family protein [bacterium]MBU1674378.1 hemerythrin family protein [bacterium]